MAMLDAILCPEWESRYYSFDARWAPGEELASMRNGSGDVYSIVFSAAGAFIRGFDHESPMSPFASGRNRVWPGVVDSVPGVFADYLAEPAFSVEGILEATVCLWRQTEDDRWHVGVIDFPAGADPDGALGLFGVLMDGSPEAYRRFAEEYYEQAIDSDAVAQVYQLRPLTEELLHRLNRDVSLADLEEDVTAIAYPSGALPPA
ncbi:MAG TPA: hypothetical protein VFP72_16910 [Kineosporiaceae bacterium]|nr:hypothetical protein [Kineosporiaceae bacterium]